jgi:hypothetical protein
MPQNTFIVSTASARASGIGRVSCVSAFIGRETCRGRSIGEYHTQNVPGRGHFLQPSQLEGIFH